MGYENTNGYSPGYQADEAKRLYSKAGGLANTSVYGEQGIGKIMGNVSKASAFRRMMLARGLTKSLHRRNIRAPGAITKMVANQSMGSFANENQMRADLFKQDYQSRYKSKFDSLGLQSGMLPYLEQEPQGGGFLGFMGDLTGMLGAIPGAGGFVGNLLGLGKKEKERRD